jgi:hypothetical protein
MPVKYDNSNESIKRLGKDAPPGTKVGSKSSETIMSQNLGLKSNPNPDLKKINPVDDSHDLGSYVNEREKKFGIKHKTER